MSPPAKPGVYLEEITDAENEAGQELGRAQLREWARETTAHSPNEVGEALLHRLEKFRGRLRNDDETLLVLQRDLESLPLLLVQVARSYTVGRVRRSLRKAG